jgi:uroporphyrinogen-III decarboxylase
MRWYPGENLPSTHAKPTLSESWFHHHYGFSFGKKYYSDPICRTEQDRQARRLLWDRFKGLGLGSPDPAQRPDLDVCGHRFMPALFGCEVVFQEAEAPAARGLHFGSPEALAALPKPTLESNSWAQEFKRQGKVLLDRYGFVDATINFGGPLNVASLVVGTEMFTYLADAEPAARRFLDMVADLCLECYDQLTLPFCSELGAGRVMSIGNCPVGMISPKMYEAQVLPSDMRLRNNVGSLVLHHCGVVDGYLKAYQALRPLGWIEVGWGSDVAAARAAFPATIFDLMINV